MTDFLIPEDLQVFAPTLDESKAFEMIADATALAVLLAPCIAADEFAYTDAVKAVLRAAILRWNDAGSGATQSQTAGPFSQTIDTRQPRKGMFWPSEIEQLQALCNVGAGSSYSVSMDTDDTNPTAPIPAGFGPPWSSVWT